jgi:hypothetical protein
VDDFYDGPFVFTGATEDQQRWERARPSLERNGLTSREHGLGIASYETGHTVIIPWNHDQRQWKMTILHGDHPVHTKGISVSLGQGDESVGDRAMAHLRRPDVMQSMRDQMDPATDDDGSWPRRF